MPKDQDIIEDDPQQQSETDTPFLIPELSKKQFTEIILNTIDKLVQDGTDISSGNTFYNCVQKLANDKNIEFGVATNDPEINILQQMVGHDPRFDLSYYIFQLTDAYSIKEILSHLLNPKETLKSSVDAVVDDKYVSLMMSEIRIQQQNTPQPLTQEQLRHYGVEHFNLPFTTEHIENLENTLKNKAQIQELQRKLGLNEQPDQMPGPMPSNLGTPLTEQQIEYYRAIDAGINQLISSNITPTGEYIPALEKRRSEIMLAKLNQQLQASQRFETSSPQPVVSEAPKTVPHAHDNVDVLVSAPDVDTKEEPAALIAKHVQPTLTKPPVEAVLTTTAEGKSPTVVNQIDVTKTSAPVAPGSIADARVPEKETRAPKSAKTIAGESTPLGSRTNVPTSLTPMAASAGATLPMKKAAAVQQQGGADVNTIFTKFNDRAFLDKFNGTETIKATGAIKSSQDEIKIKFEGTKQFELTAKEGDIAGTTNWYTEHDDEIEMLKACRAAVMLAFENKEPANITVNKKGPLKVKMIKALNDTINEVTRENIDNTQITEMAKKFIIDGQPFKIDVAPATSAKPAKM